jgi:hypothetical protein
MFHLDMRSNGHKNSWNDWNIYPSLKNNYLYRHLKNKEKARAARVRAIITTKQREVKKGPQKRRGCS